MVKAIFFDIDGTLISFNTHTMPESTLASLHTLRSQGIKLFVSTGRPKKNIGFLNNFFHFDGYITLNGQYCFTPDGKVFHDHPISADNIEKVIPYLEKNKIACDFVESEKMYINLINEKVTSFYNRLGNTVKPAPIEDIKQAIGKKIYQLSPFISEEEEDEFFIHMPDCKSARWCTAFTDVVPLDGGKGSGLLKALDYYGIRQSESMAFGDGGNDIEMLQTAQIGVAMGNGGEKVKHIADYVTASVDNDGIYKALCRFGVIEKKKLKLQANACL